MLTLRFPGYLYASHAPPPRRCSGTYRLRQTHPAIDPGHWIHHSSYRLDFLYWHRRPAGDILRLGWAAPSRRPLHPGQGATARRLRDGLRTHLGVTDTDTDGYRACCCVVGGWRWAFRRRETRGWCTDKRWRGGFAVRKVRQGDLTSCIGPTEVRQYALCLSRTKSLFIRSQPNLSNVARIGVYTGLWTCCLSIYDIRAGKIS